MTDQEYLKSMCVARRSMPLNVKLTEKQAKALVDCLDMVLSIQGSIKKGDPDFAPLVQLERKVRVKLLDAK